MSCVGRVLHWFMAAKVKDEYSNMSSYIEVISGTDLIWHPFLWRFPRHWCWVSPGSSSLVQSPELVSTSPVCPLRRRPPTHCSPLDLCTVTTYRNINKHLTMQYDLHEANACFHYIIISNELATLYTEVMHWGSIIEWISLWVPESCPSSLVRCWRPLLVSLLLSLQTASPFFWPGHWFCSLGETDNSLNTQMCYVNSFIHSLLQFPLPINYLMIFQIWDFYRPWGQTK